MPYRIGLIADTHGFFDPSVRRHFNGVDRIIHAGDIGDPAVIEQLQEIAPVVMVSGNVDGYRKSGIAMEAILRVGRKRIAVRHVVYESGTLTRDGLDFLTRTGPDICIFGHTHRPTIHRLEGTLMINPGSAGPKRFSLPRKIGILTIDGTRARYRSIRLPERPSRNRAKAKRLP
ncbi:putative Phosphoesterase [Nitrospira sp. KM1]|uniref:metallophosphoesterase family protein n=1 Tax=Nitrospira sp. KM1 TaxID=1936990 RepID=UPI0013A79E3A|nr:metallophosphoesterase family protein [Nitrospira sp. KM1]BCA55074.1 putative Phosphoesterase [Nitrospira sp. KM1]